LPEFHSTQRCGSFEFRFRLLGSETDTYLYLKYYAEDDWRQKWVADFPDYDMPVYENPPFDRDRHLPQPDDETPSETEAERTM
jgi:hypothetical protein